MSHLYYTLSKLDEIEIVGNKYLVEYESPILAELVKELHSYSNPTLAQVELALAKCSINFADVFSIGDMQSVFEQTDDIVPLLISAKYMAAIMIGVIEKMNYRTVDTDKKVHTWGQLVYIENRKIVLRHTNIKLPTIEQIFNYTPQDFSNLNKEVETYVVNNVNVINSQVARKIDSAVSLINSFDRNSRVIFSARDTVGKEIRNALMDFVGTRVEVEHLPYMYETVKIALTTGDALDYNQKLYYESWMISHAAYPAKPSVMDLLKYKEKANKSEPKKSSIFV